MQKVFADVLQDLDRWERDREEAFVSLQATLVEHRLVDQVRRSHAARRDVRRVGDQGPQAAGDGAPRAALDIYGLSATLYHLVTLQPPHQGDLQQVLVALRRDDPVPAKRLCPGLPCDLQAILGSKRKAPQRAISAAARLEGIYGYATARTQHTLAATHRQQGLFAKAIPYCEESLRLRPDRHGPWTNLGFANLRLGRFDEAEATANRILDDGWREYELRALALARSLQALRADGRAAIETHALAGRAHFQRSAADAASDNPKQGRYRGRSCWRRYPPT